MNKNDRNKLGNTAYSNLNWIRVLDEIWKYAPNQYSQGDRAFDDDNPLAKKLKISGYELILIISFLQDQKLIKYDSTEHNWIELTPKGFDVALQNRNMKNNDISNKMLHFLTYILVIVAIISMLIGIENIILKISATLALIIAVFLGGIIFRNSPY